MAPLIPVYHLLFISLKNVRPSRNLPGLFCLLCRRHNFLCPPIKCQWPHSGPGRPHLNWQHFQITSFSSVGLCLRILGACWGSNRISLPFKFQLQLCYQRARPSLHSSYFWLFFFFFCVRPNIVWLQYGAHWQRLCFRPGVLSALPRMLDSSHFCDETY